MTDINSVISKTPHGPEAKQRPVYEIEDIFEDRKLLHAAQLYNDGMIRIWTGNFFENQRFIVSQNLIDETVSIVPLESDVYWLPISKNVYDTIYENVSATAFLADTTTHINRDQARYDWLEVNRPYIDEILVYLPNISYQTYIESPIGHFDGGDVQQRYLQSIDYIPSEGVENLAYRTCSLLKCDTCEAEFDRGSTEERARFATAFDQLIGDTNWREASNSVCAGIF